MINYEIEISNFSNAGTMLTNILTKHNLLTTNDILNNKEKILNIRGMGKKSYVVLDMTLQELGISSDFLDSYDKIIRDKKLKRKNKNI